MNLKEKFPHIMMGMKEEIEELRYLLVIDENYDDVDSDEFDVFDPSEFNYMVYVTEELQEVLGKDRLQKAIDKMETCEDFKAFYANDTDLYGLMTTLDEVEIAEKILGMMEATLS